MDDRQAIRAIKDILQTNLTDPRAQYSNDSRDWVHTDRPLQSATYPRVQVRKRGPSSSTIISFGNTDFLEWYSMILDIQIWVKSPFKWQQDDGTYIKDEELVREWQRRIWKTLKASADTLKNTYDITGLKNNGEDDPFWEDDSQMMTGITSVRLWYFER